MLKKKKKKECRYQTMRGKEQEKMMELKKQKEMQKKWKEGK